MNDLTHVDKDEGVKLSPEALTIVNSYIQTNDISATSNMLGIPREKIIQQLNKREAKKYIDTIYLEQGYLNRNKIAEAMTNIIEKKLEELEMAEMGSTKDIADLLMMMSKIRSDELKYMQAIEKEEKAVTNQTNIQNNFSNDQFGANYTNLLDKLTDTK